MPRRSSRAGEAFPILFETGNDAVDFGIVKKSGAWFTYEGEQLGQGREKAKEFLRSNPEVTVEVSDKVLIASGLKEDPNADPSGGDQWTDADDQPIELGD